MTKIRNGAGRLALVATSSLLILSIAAPAVAQDFSQALSTGSATTPAATAPAPAGPRPHPCDTQRCILVEDPVPGMPIEAAHPYNSDDDQLMTLAMFNAHPGNNGGGEARFNAIYTGANADLCFEFGSWTMEHTQIIQDWAKLVPGLKAHREFYIELEARLRGNTWMRRGGKLVQGAAFSWGQTFKYAFGVVIGLLTGEWSDTISDDEREWSRRGNLMWNSAMAITIRANILHQRESMVWANLVGRKVCPIQQPDATRRGIASVPMSDDLQEALAEAESYGDDEDSDRRDRRERRRR